MDLLRRSRGGSGDVPRIGTEPFVKQCRAGGEREQHHQERQLETLRPPPKTSSEMTPNSSGARPVRASGGRCGCSPLYPELRGHDVEPGRIEGSRLRREHDLGYHRRHIVVRLQTQSASLVALGKRLSLRAPGLLRAVATPPIRIPSISRAAPSAITRGDRGHVPRASRTRRGPTPCRDRPSTSR